jgi:rare lipoprotein A
MKDELFPGPAPLSLSFILHPSSFILCAALAAALSGCGSAPSREAPIAKAPPAPRGGGYYLDDGPGASPPADIDGIQDAVPRLEPVRSATSRPYTVMGRSYTPMTSLQPYTARGIATWYGRRYHGKQTSSGEIYDMYAMTAAHTTLPIPSYARVTHLANGKSVVVRINDRGPFVEGRIIDLSYTAAHKLGVLAGGSAMVEVEAIIPGRASVTPTVAPFRAEPEPVVTLPAAVVDPPPPTPPSIPVTADAGRYYLQLGAFGSRENAENFLARLQSSLGAADNLHIHARDQLYRVHAGPYATEAGARQAGARLGESLGLKPVVLTR